MAEAFEGEVKFKGLEEAARDFRELENRINGTSESMGSAAGASSNMAQNITAGVVAAQAAWAAITKLATAVKAAADEFERQAGIMNRFSGDIGEASRRTNGLISQLDLMTASSRASAAGLTLTADQFASISVQASEFAARTGGDATQALNGLISAIATGRAGQLLQYGVDLQGITSITDKQNAAVAALTEGYGDMESSADTLGGRLAVLETRIDDVQTNMIQLVGDSGLVEDAFDRLTNSASMLLGELSLFGGGGSGPVSDFEAFVMTGIATMDAFSKQIEIVSKMFGALQDALADPTNTVLFERVAAFAQDLNNFEGNMQESFNTGLRNRADAQARRADSAPRPFRKNEDEEESTTRRRSPSADDDAARAAREAEAAAYAERALESQEQALEIMRQQYELQQASFDNDAAKQAAAGELAKLEQERLELMAMQTEETRKQKEAIEEAEEAEKERQATQKQAERIQEGISSGLDGIASITKKTIALTEEGGMSAKDAFVTATDEWLKQFAIQEAWKGAGAFIEGVGAAVMNTGHSVAKFTEAAGHFAIAAAAGGASAAIPNVGGGAPPADTGASRPEAAGGQNTGGGGGMYVVNFNSPVADSQLGALQNRMDRAATRRFGT